MTTTVTMYAIRHKPTGKYLPVPQGRGGRGGSHVEPLDFSEPRGTKGKDHTTRGMIPRLWSEERMAKTALTVWCQGKFYSDSEGDIFNKRIESRVYEDMEVVEVKVELP